jgi:hypothetical protein
MPTTVFTSRTVKKLAEHSAEGLAAMTGGTVTIIIETDKGRIIIERGPIRDQKRG